MDTQRLCVDHGHLHGGKPHLISNHDDCEVCQQLGYSEQSPPPTSNFDYDAYEADGAPRERWEVTEGGGPADYDPSGLLGGAKR